MKIVITDGGRSAAGFRGSPGDCVTRAFAIVTDRPYQEIYDLFNTAAKVERPRKGRSRSSSRTGVKTPTIRRVAEELGFVWTPTMSIGSGCTVHVREDELPATGRHVLSLSRHVSALIDGVVYDSHDPSRDGTRCVYGFWTLKP